MIDEKSLNCDACGRELDPPDVVRLTKGRVWCRPCAKLYGTYGSSQPVSGKDLNRTFGQIVKAGRILAKTAHLPSPFPTRTEYDEMICRCGHEVERSVLERDPEYRCHCPEDELDRGMGDDFCPECQSVNSFIRKD